MNDGQVIEIGRPSLQGIAENGDIAGEGLRRKDPDTGKDCENDLDRLEAGIHNNDSFYLLSHRVPDRSNPEANTESAQQWHRGKDGPILGEN
jgi:hypothetical protein